MTQSLSPHRSARWFTALLAITFAARFCPSAVFADDVEAAVLSENWPRVSELIGKITAQTPPEQRFLKGHACLALNQNNDSVRLFLDSDSPADLAAWRNWTEAFTQAHHDAAVAHYLRGDSLARMEKYEQAIEVFDAGLNIAPNYALLLNAKGVCCAKLGRLPEARKCFEGAIEASGSKLADAYANLGSYWLQVSDSPEGGERAFTKAIEISSGFAYAKVGRGCVRLILGRSSASEDLDEAFHSGDHFKTMVASELVRYGLFSGGADREAIAEEMLALGTTVKREYSVNKLVQSATFWAGATENLRNDKALGPVGNALANFCGNRLTDQLGTIRRDYGNDAMVKAVGSNPLLKSVAPSEINRVGDYNRSIGGTERFIKDTAGLGSAAAGFIPDPRARIASSGLAVLSKTADISNRWSTDKVDLQNALNQHLPIAPPIRNTPSSALPIPEGGAALSMKKAKWDTGNWPFEPLYGLACGIHQAPATVPGTQPAK